MSSPATMLRSSLMTSGAVTTMWRSEEKPAPTSSMARRRPRGPEGRQHGRERVVVLDLVVLGELEQHPVQRQAGEQLAALGGQQGGGGDVHGDVAGDDVEVRPRRARGRAARGGGRARRCALRRSTTSGAWPHSAGKRLSASAPTRSPVARSTMGCSTTSGPPAAMSGLEPVLDLGAALLLAHAGLDDHRRGRGEHVHQRLVALGQLLVGGEAGGAEGAVERAVAEDHGDRHVAADAAASAPPAASWPRGSP